MWRRSFFFRPRTAGGAPIGPSTRRPFAPLSSPAAICCAIFPSQAQSQLISLRSDLDRQKIITRQSSLRPQQQVGLANVKLEAAKRNLDRYQRMFTQGLGNRIDLESAQDAVRIAEMELAQAQNELTMGDETLAFDLRNRQEQVVRQQSVTDELQRKVNELTVRAPFDGMVATMNVQDRHAIAPNQAVLTIVNLSSFELELPLPEVQRDRRRAWRPHHHARAMAAALQ